MNEAHDEKGSRGCIGIFEGSNNSGYNSESLF